MLSWQQHPQSPPVAISSRSYHTVIDGKFFVIGGNYNRSRQRIVQWFDGEKWESYTPPFNARSNGALVARDGGLIMIGGYDGGSSSGLQEIWVSHNPTSASSWTLATDSAPKRIYNRAVVFSDSYIPSAQVPPFSMVVDATRDVFLFNQTGEAALVGLSEIPPYAVFLESAHADLLSVQDVVNGVKRVAVTAAVTASLRFAVTVRGEDGSSVTPSRYAVFSIAFISSVELSAPASVTVPANVTQAIDVLSLFARGGMGDYAYTVQGVAPNNAGAHVELAPSDAVAGQPAVLRLKNLSAAGAVAATISASDGVSAATVVVTLNPVSGATLTVAAITLTVARAAQIALQTLVLDETERYGELQWGIAGIDAAEISLSISADSYFTLAASGATAMISLLAPLAASGEVRVTIMATDWATADIPVARSFAIVAILFTPPVHFMPATITLGAANFDGAPYFLLPQPGVPPYAFSLSGAPLGGSVAIDANTGRLTLHDVWPGSEFFVDATDAVGDAARLHVFVEAPQPLSLSAAILNSDIYAFQRGDFAAVAVFGGVPGYTLRVAGHSPYFGVTQSAGANAATVVLTAGASAGAVIGVTIVAQDAHPDTTEASLVLVLTLAAPPQNLYADGDILLLGGELSDSDADDVWTNASGNAQTQWSRLDGASGAGQAGDVKDAAVATFGGKVFVMGGLRGEAVSNAVWRSADGGNTWRQFAAPWSARHGHGALVFDNALWIMGGADASGAGLADVWRSVDGEQWTRASEGGFSPALLNFAAGVLDGVSSTVAYVAGGRWRSDGNAYNEELWHSADMVTWQKHGAKPAPIGWSPYFTVSGGRLFVVGGYAHDEGGIQDIAQWWDGFAWGSHNPPFLPRYEGALVSRNGGLILLGGRDDDGYLNEVWVNNTPDQASGWTREGESADVPWSGRARQAALVYGGSYISAAQVPDFDALWMARHTPLVTYETGAAAVLTLSGGIGPYSLSVHFGEHGELLSLSRDAGGAAATLHLTGAATVAVQISVVVRAEDNHVATPPAYATLVVSIAAPQPLALSVTELQDDFFVYHTGDYAVVGASGGLRAYTLRMAGQSSCFALHQNADGDSAIVALTAAVAVAATLSVTVALQDAHPDTSEQFITLALTVFPLSQNVYAVGDILMAGGELNSTGSAEELWINTNGESPLQWTRQDGASGAGRAGDAKDAAMAAFAGKAFILGGIRDNSASSDVWHSADGRVWQRYAAPWPARFGAGAVVFDNALWLFGGAAVTGEAWRDVWRSADGMHWERRSETGFVAGVLNFASGVVGGAVYVAGGRTRSDGNAYNKELWHSADMVTWQKHSAKPAPIGWSPYFTVSDGRLFVVGGFAHDKGGRQDIVQWWDGTSWNSHNPPFSSRYRGALVSRNGELLLLGGRYRGGNKGNINEVWFNKTPTVASGWTRQEGNIPWSRRARQAALVYDASYIPAAQVPDFGALWTARHTPLVTYETGAAAVLKLSGGIVPYSLSVHFGDHGGLLSLSYQEGAAAATLHLTNAATVALQISVVARADDSHAATSPVFATLAVSIAVPQPLGLTVIPIRTDFIMYQTKEVIAAEGIADIAAISVFGGLPAYAISLAGASPYFGLRTQAGASAATVALTAAITVATVARVTLQAQDSHPDTPDLRFTLSVAIAAPPQNVYDRGDIILIGGRNTEGYLSEVWTHSEGDALRKWSLSSDGNGGGTAGDALYAGAASFGGRVYITGGSQGGWPSNRVWHSGDGGQTWQSYIAPWSARYGHAALVHDHALWVFGGINESGGLMRDVWRSADGKNWSRESGSGFSPRLRNFASGVLRGTVYAAGGIGSGSSGLWHSTDMKTWKKHGASPLPIGGSPAHAVSDGRFYVAGGSSSDGEGLVQWFDGERWGSYRAPFSHRTGGALVAREGGLILLGGADGRLNDKNEIWTSEDPTVAGGWRREKGSVSWRGRRGHSALLYSAAYVPSAQVPDFSLKGEVVRDLFVAGETGVAARISLAGGIGPYSLLLEGAPAGLFSLAHDGGNAATVLLTSKAARPMKATVVARSDDSHAYTPSDFITLVIDIIAGDVILVGGEHDAFTAADDVWVLASGDSLGQWNKQSNVSGAGKLGAVKDAAMIKFAGKAFVLGGLRGWPSNEVWHSADGRAWQSYSAPWTARWGHGAVVFDSALWIFGGYTSGLAKGRKDVWRSVDGMKWTRASADGFAPALYNFASGIVNGVAYVAGGRAREFKNKGSGRVELTYRFNESLWYSTDMKTWKKHSASPAPIGWSPYYTVADDKLFVIGGYHPDHGGRQDIVQWFDGKTWGSHNPPFSTRYRGSLIWRGGELVMMGGRDKTGNKGNINEIWTNVDPTNAATWNRQVGSAPWKARARASALVFYEAQNPK